MAHPVEEAVEEAARLLGLMALLAMGLRLFRLDATVHRSVRQGRLGHLTMTPWVLTVVVAAAAEEEEEEEGGMTRIQATRAVETDLIDQSRPTSWYSKLFQRTGQLCPSGALTPSL
jgi:hypothetical protein